MDSPDIRIVLVAPSHPGNIGAVARAMKNMALDDLTLVRPRSFPHPESNALAAGADDILAKARVVDSVVYVHQNAIFGVGFPMRCHDNGGFIQLEELSFPPRGEASL